MKTHFAPGLHPFWFWNDCLDEAQVEKRVAQLAAAGCKGVFIHPRQGLGVPYLSARYFELYRCCIRACVAHDITPHMYDEFPYPSGIAGGEVCMGHPEFMATKLTQFEQQHSGGAVNWELPSGDILQCVAVPIRHKQAQWDQAIDLRPQAGIYYQHKTWFQAGLTNYGNQRYFAHDPAWRILSDLPEGEWLLSASIQGVVDHHKYWNNYVDVCDPAAIQRFIACTHEVYARALGEDLKHIGCCFVDETHPTWSRHFEAAYRERYQDDFHSQLIALQQNDHPQHHLLQQRLDDLRYELFVEAFEKPIAAWCRQHDILYVAEKPLLRVDQLRYVDVPGCDCGHVRCGATNDTLRPRLRGNARAMSSAAQIYGKDAACCEAYHSLGWSATLEDARINLDLLLLHGIDRIVTHGFFETTHALAKHDAPPSWFSQRPDWPHARHLADRLERISEIIGTPTHDADCYVIDPRLNGGDDASVYYEQFLHALTASKREYLIIDRVWLLEHDPQTGVISGKSHVQSIIAPPCIHDAHLQAWLDLFQQAGGTVLAYDVPDDTDAIGCSVINGDPSTLHQTRYHSTNGMVVMAINLGSEALDISVPAGFSALDIGDAPTTLHNNQCRIEAFATMCWRAEHNNSAVQMPKQNDAEMCIINWPEKWAVQAEQANLARLGHWELSVKQEGQTQRGAHSVIPKPIGDQIHQARIPLHYQRQSRFGQTAILSLPPIHVTYTSQIHCDTEMDNVLLVIEPGSIRGQDWRIHIHDYEFSANDFTVVDAHVEGSLGVRIPNLDAGQHHISVHLTATRDDDGLLAPIYLGGNCAVQVQPLRLSNTIMRAPFGDLDQAGLTHYAGSILWHAQVAINPGNQTFVEIDCSFCALDAFEIQFNDGAWHAMDWAPRKLRIPSSELRHGINTCRIRQFSTLGRSFDGQRWIAAEHRLEDILE